MRSCDDGYPSCRRAEEKGEWCKNECLAAIQIELKELLEKRDRIREKQMDSYRSRSATRARTTTRNADVDRINDRIIWLRQQIKCV